MKELTKDVDTKVGIKVVLNGGEPEMDSATIPIEWWFSKEVIKQNPTHILIFEQDAREKEKGQKYGGNDNCFYGRRYLCKISPKIKFLQIFSPGYHRIMVVALAGEDVKKLGQRYLKRERVGYYGIAIDWEKAENNILYLSDVRMIASVVEEFEVPEELFAKKPETKPGRLVWKLANLWYEKDPIDQCDYRKRKILTFPLKLILALIVYAIKYGIGGTFYALYVLLASLTVLFFGYRPEPILKEMKDAFLLKREKLLSNWDVKMYRESDGDGLKSNFRLWSKKEISEGTHEYEYKYMPTSPFQVVLILIALPILVLACIAIIPLISVRFLLTILVAIGVIGLVVVAAYYFLSKVVFREERKTQRRQARAEREKRREIGIKQRERLKRQWLLKNFELSQQTEEIDLDRLPKPLERKDRVVQKFYVNFWVLKRKLCKPYAK